MVVLKKVKASSLNEVIVATVIIVLVFGIAMSTLNNIMQNIANRDVQFIQTKLNELVYEYQQGKIKLPFSIVEDQWTINIRKASDFEVTTVEFEITNTINKKTLQRKIVTNEKD